MTLDRVVQGIFQEFRSPIQHTMARIAVHLIMMSLCFESFFASEVATEPNLRGVAKKEPHNDAQAEEAAQVAFLSQVDTQKRRLGGSCDDGRGDLRGSECAADNCKRCLGNGAVLTFSPGRTGGFTRCAYNPPIRGQPSVFCGEGFGDGTSATGAAEMCQCCRGAAASLQFFPGHAEGLGYTYCMK